MHLADVLASSNKEGLLAPSNNSQEMSPQGGGASESSFFSGFSSSFDSLGDDDDSFITSDLMDEDDEDDSLRDTACSSAAGPKVGNKELPLVSYGLSLNNHSISSRSNMIMIFRSTGNQHV